MHRPRCSTKPPNNFGSMVPRVLAGLMAIWDTGSPSALASAYGGGYAGLAGPVGIQTRIAPGPRLSHWKYGIAVKVTGWEGKIVGGRAVLGAVLKARGLDLSRSDLQLAVAGELGGWCQPGAVSWIVWPMPGRVTACSVGVAP